MAALDTPWLLTQMSTPSKPRGDGDVDGSVSSPIIENPYGAVPPTYAAFSSSNLSTTATAAARRSTILVHQKSPLLLATPPQVTRALAYSHPFLLPLNKLAGLLSWTTGDAWESFLLLVVFWATVQYGDFLVRIAGPIVIVVGIIAGMYGRRYSPLSSSGWGEHPSWASSSTSKSSKKSAAAEGSAAGGASGKKGEHQRNTSESTNTRHQKTLDEIVDTVKVFTTRCNILLEPLLLMTDFLSTQRTATSATTRPALTAMFVRILAVTPIWFALTLPPLRIITTKRVIMVFGTLVLSWHSRICKVTRTLLWRSSAVRRVARWVTGLEFEGPKKPTKDVVNGKATTTTDVTATKKSQSTSALTTLLQRSRSGYSGKETGVRFTFILYENQRRWVGLGWTNNLFAYERSAWTDEHNNAVPPKDDFELPEVEDGHAKWRWVKGSKWRVDGVPAIQDEHDYDSDAGKNGWIYYDNKWNNGRRGADGWGRWTRRRKWYRDAELVEVNDEADQISESSTPAVPARSPSPPELPARPAPPRQDVNESKVAPTLSSSVQSGSSDPGHSQTSNEPERDNEETDTASVLSTSSTSKSARGFKWPGFGINPYAHHSHSNPPSIRGSSAHRKAMGAGTGDSKRSRRTSDSVNSAHENEVGSLTPALELEIQGSRKEQASWGFGDEVSMGLE
ncbi:Pex24p-domain-containing protein [Apiospora arundinis]|uniref:Pex24p-domain-containing protein n=1 Tax=Apiospora arundinis TaxID=335852 RepID=A0ABR2I9G9_9PEZI